MISRPRPKKNWAWLAVIFVLIAQWVFVIWAASNRERHKTWDHLIIFPMWPAYGDLGALAEGWDDNARGVDPLRQTNDPPRYNYPRLWLPLSHLGLRSSDTPWLGALLVGGFFAAAGFVAKQTPGWSKWLVVAITLSAPLRLGLERGNTDLLIFALLTPALAASPKNARGKITALGAVVLAAMLKYYPIVCIGAWLRDRSRPQLYSLTAAAVVFALYLMATRNDTHAIFAKTERGGRESYGAAIAGDTLRWSWTSRVGYTASEPSWLSDDKKREWAFRIFTISLLVVGVFGGLSDLAQKAVTSRGPTSPVSAQLFLAGTAIYAATFCFGSSWAYRLVFLTWTVPLLGEWLLRGRWAARSFAVLTVFLGTAVFGYISMLKPMETLPAHYASFPLLLCLAFLAAAVLRAPDLPSHSNIARL